MNNLFHYSRLLIFHCNSYIHLTSFIISKTVKYMINEYQNVFCNFLLSILLKLLYSCTVKPRYLKLVGTG